MLIEEGTCPSRIPFHVSNRSLLVEHVSQLSQPECKFCLKRTSDPGHSDCSKLSVFSGGNSEFVTGIFRKIFNFKIKNATFVISWSSFALKKSRRQLCRVLGSQFIISNVASVWLKIWYCHLYGFASNNMLIILPNLSKLPSFLHCLVSIH